MRARSMSVPLVVLVALVGLGGACERKKSATAVADASGEARADDEGDLPAAPVVKAGVDTLLFSYVDGYGRIKTTGKIDEVPDDVKRRVHVVDLSQTPAQRQAHKYAFFADLSAARPDGTYVVSMVSRYDVAAGEKAPALLPSVPEGTVVLYTAVWCGFCKKAKAWLKDNDVPFVERDVEKTPGAQAELTEKLKKAGIQGGGIPVVDWGGELVMGFNAPRFEALLKERGPGDSRRRPSGPEPKPGTAP